MLDNEKFELDPINAEIIEWYANPADQRTQQQVADTLKVHVTTIVRHEKKWHKEIFEAVKENIREQLAQDKLNEINARIIKDAKVELLIELKEPEVIKPAEENAVPENNDADNLFYEYFVGKYFINNFINRFPCFLETYELFQFVSQTAHDRVYNNVKYKKSINAFCYWFKFSLLCAQIFRDSNSAFLA